MCPDIVSGLILEAASLGETRPVEPFDLGEDIVLCTLDSIRLSVKSNLETNYLWNTGETDTAILVTTSGKYSLTATTGDCEYSDTINVFLSESNPFGPFADTTLCYGDIFMFSLDPSFSILWEDNETSNDREISKEGRYRFTASRSDCSWTDSFDVFRDDLEPFSLGSDTILCDVDTLKLVIPQNINPSYQIKWSDGSSLNSFIVRSTGKYSLTSTSAYCQESDTIRVNFNRDLPKSLPEDTTICEQSDYTLDATQSYEATYQWVDGVTTPLRNIENEGTYIVEVQSFCTTFIDSIEIKTVNCFCTAFISNAFSPNGDNLNDDFGTVIDCSLNSYNLTIYNRWGEKIFESTDVDKRWDGFYLGKKVQQGSYFFTLNYSTEFKTAEYESGTVTVLY